MSFSGRDLMVAAGYHRYGEDFAKALSPVPSGGRGHWGGAWGRIQEPFSGAWQMNAELECNSDILCYPTVYACVTAISQDIGKMPFLLSEEQANGIFVTVQNPAYSPVLRKPNGYQTAQQFREAWQLSKLIQGNTYILKRRDNRGVVTELYVLDPNRVMPLVSERGEVYYQLYGDPLNTLPNDYPREGLVVPASEIIHDRAATLHHWLIGVPPLCAAYWPAVKNLRILKSAAQFFGNNAKPGGILTAPAGISSEDAAQIQAFWQTAYTGVNAGKVAVIGADMTFTDLGRASSADAQLVEQMQYSDKQICQAFRIPPYIVGAGEIPAGLKVDDVMNTYERLALQAPVQHMEALLNEGLSVSLPLRIDVDEAVLTRMDVSKRAEVWGGLCDDGVSTANEARRQFNLPPLEGGDTIYMQQQDFPLDQVRLNKLPAEAPAAPAIEPPAEPTEDEQERAIITAINKAFERAAA
jgi:HK97 family phage portal protein